ncbi:sensor histidine kinase [Curtobacterium sp. NPDC098951]|uniref:sensor histidine kinase n=1 Tax=Curtobacterium sp. NPDC098951 TaxID=3363974 RepID=UPI0037FEA797
MTAHVPPVTPRRRRPWSTRREWATWPVVVARIVLVVVAATLFAVAAPVTVAVYDVPVPLALLVTAVLSVSLGLAPVLPRTSSVAHLAAVAALGLLTAGSPAGPWPLPVTAIIGVGALLVVLGVRTDWRLTAAVWTAATVLTLALVAVAPGRWEPADVWAATFVVSAGSSLLLAGTAVAVGQRRAVRVELAEARRDVELEQARRRSVEERSRIARELHDVVAHSMSVVHMQAESAPFRVADLPPAARAEFAAIAETSRTALREMRQLLGTLRADTAAERAPQPGLDDLPALVRATQAAGIPVALQLDEGASGGTIDPLARLAAYRVVQEALGNVARHAPGAETAVTVARHDAVLAVEVVNAAPPRDTVAIVPPDDGGFGLTGMRERVAALGGTIDHGPLPSGGFRVRVTLPCHPGTTTLRPQADRGAR